MNASDFVRATARRLPDKPAVLFQDLSITYAELDAEIDAVAAGLASLGVRPGDRVGVLVHNVPPFITSYYGVMRAGAVMVPINVMFTGEEIAHILTDSQARVVIAAEPFAPLVDGVRHTAQMLEHLVVTGPNAPMGAMNWEQFTTRSSTPPTVETKPGDLAVLGYTSGTTGRPKGAMLTHGNLLANLEQMSSVPLLTVTDGDVALLVLPLFHIYALNVILGLTLKAGATAVLIERFDAVGSLEAIDKRKVTILFGAPPMFIAWVNTPGIERTDLSSVRVAVSGAAALPAQVFDDFKRKTGVTIWEGYGLTETAPGVTSNAMGDVAKAGSIGKPLPGVEVRIIDEDGDDVEEGDPGEIAVRGPNVFGGYWHQPDESKGAFTDDGWFRTGDIGYADAEGSIFLIDRKKDLVIVSGFNVYPREIENVLYRHPKVAECAAIGIPHPYTGEAVKALVVLKDGQLASEEELLEFCRRSLARFKLPSVIEFVKELPHLPTGKVSKRTLRGREN